MGAVAQAALDLCAKRDQFLRGGALRLTSSREAWITAMNREASMPDEAKLASERRGLGDLERRLANGAD